MSDQLRELIALWRERMYQYNDDGYETATRECADELEALLTERPQPQEAQPPFDDWASDLASDRENYGLDGYCALIEEALLKAHRFGQPRKESGAALIAAERARQVSVENWSAQHDDAHETGELTAAAARYLDAGCAFDHGGRLPDWPWEPRWWKPSDDPIRNLTKAGALIAAEIDRLTRRRNETPSTQKPLGSPTP